MNQRSVDHGGIVIERQFKAAPDRLFAAWADPEARREWALPNRGWESTEALDDFRVGGCEVSRFGPRGDPRFTTETHYLDIVPDRRIVMATTFYEGDAPISCALVTVEILKASDGESTLLVCTEQDAFLDGSESAHVRCRDWVTSLDRLAESLGE